MTLKTIRIPRVIRFASVGAICAGIQFGVLVLIVGGLSLEGVGLAENIANVFAFFFSAQINFALSYNFTWSDRKDPNLKLQKITTQLISFNAMAGMTWVVNQSTFALANMLIDYRAAALIGIGVAAVINYQLSNMFIFKSIRQQGEKRAFALENPRQDP